MAFPAELRFAWWNVCNFAHFDPNRSAFDRWPASVDAYTAKRHRVEVAFDNLFGRDPPELIGCCELTRVAADDLRTRKLANHDLVLSNPNDPTEFQIAVFVRRRVGLTERLPIFGVDVPASTRPMCVVDFQNRNATIRFVFGHWPAFDEPRSVENRGRMADALRADVYDFLYPKRPVKLPRHVVAVGDFNAEPFDDLFGLKLSASRDRDHARQRPHHTDEVVRGVRLYNCGWRFLGESHAHPLPATPVRRVGTYYHALSREWRTFDQVLVTGGLLAVTPPFLDETRLLTRTDVGNLTADGKPARFEYTNGVPSGLSDHYPVTGTIVLG